MIDLLHQQGVPLDYDKLANEASNEDLQALAQRHIKQAKTKTILRLDKSPRSPRKSEA